jgi:hypothetical protein
MILTLLVHHLLFIHYYVVIHSIFVSLSLYQLLIFLEKISHFICKLLLSINIVNPFYLFLHFVINYNYAYHITYPPYFS